MKLKRSLIALIVCMCFVMSACNVTINLPATNEPVVSANQEVVTSPETSVPKAAAPATPSGSQPSMSATDSVPKSATPADAKPVPIDERTYSALEASLSALLATDGYFMFTLGEDANSVYNKLKADSKDMAKYVGLFLYNFVSDVQSDAASGSAVDIFKNDGKFVLVDDELINAVFDFIFKDKITADVLKDVAAGSDYVELRDGDVYVMVSAKRSQPDAEAEFLRVNDDGTVMYTFDYDIGEAETEGVLTVTLEPDGKSEYGAHMKSFTVDGAASETPVGDFVNGMSACLTYLGVKYELISKDGSAFSVLTGNPTFADLDYFWLDATTQPHSDKTEVTYINLKFNSPIDDNGKLILLQAIRALSQFATLEELEAKLNDIHSSGQGFVCSAIVEYADGTYRINLPDVEMD